MSSLPIAANTSHGLIITTSNTTPRRGYHQHVGNNNNNPSSLLSSCLNSSSQQQTTTNDVIGSSISCTNDYSNNTNSDENLIVGKEEEEITQSSSQECQQQPETTTTSPLPNNHQHEEIFTLKSLCIEFLMKHIECFSKPPSNVYDNNYYEFLEKVDNKLKRTPQQLPNASSTSSSSYKNLLKQRSRSSSNGKSPSTNMMIPSMNNYYTTTNRNAVCEDDDDGVEEVYPLPQSIAQHLVNELSNSKQVTLPLLIKLRCSGLSNLNLSLNGRVHDDWMMLLRELPLENLNLSHCLITNQSLYYVKGKKQIIPASSNNPAMVVDDNQNDVNNESESSESDDEEEETTCQQKKSVSFSFDSATNPNRKSKKKKKKKMVANSSSSVPPPTPHKRSSSADNNSNNSSSTASSSEKKTKSSGPKSTTSSGSGGSGSGGSSSRRRRDGSIQITTPYTLSRTLKSLNMSNINEMSHDSFKLIPQLFPNLTALSFEGCSQFTNKCLEHICGKVHNKSSEGGGNSNTTNADGDLNSTKFKQPLRRNLKKLNLKKTKISDAGVRNLQSLINLEYLNLSENKQLTNHCLKFLKDLKFLSFLALDGNERMTEDGLSCYLHNSASQMTGLSISGTYMGDENPQHFATFPQLSYFNASNTNIHSLPVPVVVENGFRHLTSLNLSHCKLLDDHSMKKFFESLNCLCEVNLSSTFLDDEALSGLLSSKNSLKILQLNNCVHLSDLAFEHILPSLNNICELGLRQMKHISYGNGWSHLFNAKSFEKLEKLYLTASFMNHKSEQLNQQGFSAAFANICKNLKVLDMSCNLKGIDDDCLGDALSATNSSNGSCNLEWIDFSHCDRISSKTISNLSKTCCKTLTHLAISYCKKVDGTSIPLLSSCKKLEVLYLSGINVLPQHFAKLANLERISDLSVMDCKSLEQQDGCSEFLFVLSSLCKFKNKLLMLNLYGLYVEENALMYLVGLENLVTLRISTHEELEDLGALYDLHNLVYLKTNVLQTKNTTAVQQDYKSSKGFNREVFSI